MAFASHPHLAGVISRTKLICDCPAEKNPVQACRDGRNVTSHDTAGLQWRVRNRICILERGMPSLLPSDVRGRRCISAYPIQIIAVNTYITYNSTQDKSFMLAMLLLPQNGIWFNPVDRGRGLDDRASRDRKSSRLTSTTCGRAHH